MPHANVSNLQRHRAKQLRATMTPAEMLLWRYIKAHRIDGLSFRRQVPIQNYIVDFVCLSAKLVIELDGMSHSFGENISADAKRDAFFSAHGFRVLRVRNEDVVTNLEGVIELIRQTAISPQTDAPPSPPLPHKGGGSNAAVNEDFRGNRS